MTIYYKNNPLLPRAVTGIDINADSKYDLAIADQQAIYITYGDMLSDRFDISLLNTTTGFKILNTRKDINFTNSITETDINGDGISDLIVGTKHIRDKNYNHTQNEYITAAFVVFGSKIFPEEISTSNLKGKNGFEIIADERDFTVFEKNSNKTSSGHIKAVKEFDFSVIDIGDINSDGISDLMVNVNFPDYREVKGYVIYGAKSFSNIFNISELNGKDGFKIISGKSALGFQVTKGGDINGDGLSDILIGECEILYTVYGKDCV